MQTFRLHHPNDIKLTDIEESATAIGFFDGLHRGHQSVIDEMSRIAEEKGLKKAVMTFDPHPSVVLNPKQQRTTYVTPLDVKLDMLEKKGIDYCFIIHFSSSFASLDPDYFVQEYIIGSRINTLIAGFDFTYGYKGRGNINTLADYDEFTVRVIDKCECSGSEAKISTTKIREDLSEGNIQYVNDALGRTYSVSGLVVQGEKRGRTIGFPTANIESEYRYFLPRNGVYAVTLRLNNEGTLLKGVCNVGVKPTFHDSAVKPSIEVHLFDFDRSIYGESVTVYWHEFIRDEKKFNGIEELVAQITKDKDTAETLLSEVSLSEPAV